MSENGIFSSSAQKSGGLILKIKRLIKFFSTFIGQIVFFLISVLLIGLLIYIIASVILKDVAKIIGIEGGAQSSAGNYAYLNDLANSGYDEMLNTQELVAYHAFEYAVLMDAARFMEETGTLPLQVVDSSPIDFEELKDDGVENRRQWAYLAALALAGNLKPEDEAFAASTSSWFPHEIESTSGALEINDKLFEGSDYTVNTDRFTTQHSSENLFYHPVYNQYTKEKSLIPYLEITRNYDIVRYYIEYRDNGGAISEETENKGINWNFSEEKLKKFLGKSRFEGGINENYQGLQAGYLYIYNHLYPLNIVYELNAANMYAYGKSDANYNPNPGKADLYKDYAPSLYYTTDSLPTNHKIPLRILLDRFLPNAVLMSSWRILKDDNNTQQDVVDEIQKIYSDACLTSEEESGEKLLLKDVYSVSGSVTSQTSAEQLFERPINHTDAQAKYIDGEKTKILYNSYEALFDSRIWKEKDSGDSQLPPTIPIVSSQKFSGSFKDDVIDDIKLVLTHFSKISKLEMTEFGYEKVLEDAERLINPIDSEPTSTEQIVIYTPKENGGYWAECVLGHENESHYSNGKHINYIDPYSADETIQKCFAPLLKVAYTQKNGIRMTSVIVYYDGTYMGFVIKGKEITDYSLMSNKSTFAYFETRDINCTTVRHWEIARTGEQSHEKWFVEDAFEGMELGKDDFSLMIFFDKRGEKDSIKIPLEEIGFTDQQFAEALYKLKINGKPITIKAIFEAGNLAIVRTPEDSTSRIYGDLLEMPANPSLSNGSLSTGQSYHSVYGNNSSTIRGGETIITEKLYINLKELGLESGDEIEFDSSEINVSVPRVEEILIVALYLDSIGREFYKEALYDDHILELAYSYAHMNKITYLYDSVSVGASDEFSVIFPTRRSIISITQEFWDKQIRFYLVKGSKLWSSIKEFKNTITVAGEFKNRGNYMYLINSNPYCKGLDEYICKKEINWRCKLFAPILAGNDSANTNARESDILLILSEWLEASEQELHAANHFIRDLYALINYSKGVEDDKGSIEAVKKENGDPYIHPGSYTYLYIPDEILKFDDTTSEKAFWLDRLICTPSDPIEQDIENYLRSKSPTFTWQIVDYQLYEECQNSDGTARVYPLWMFGDQMSRTFYAIAANSSDKENQMVFGGWGGYASGTHAAADLYGRNLAKKIYNEVFGSSDSARIKAEYQVESAALKGNENTSGDGAALGFNEDVNMIEQGDKITIDAYSTAGTGLFFNNIPVNLKLNNKLYKFGGTAAAVYGYELYRQTLILKDGEKAEALLKEQLEKEMKWSEERAVAPGIVTEVKGDARGGFTVRIEHSDSVKTSYLHMKRFPLVQVGQYVGAGTLLGYEGTTGNSGTFHVHFSIRKTDDPSEPQPLVNPVTYLYPFFTPFYYKEKAAENNYALDSEYMSTTRTVFPYGQVSGVTSPEYWTTEVTGENIVKIKNYVPYKVFIDDSTKLYSEEDNISEKYIDFSKLPTKNVKTNLDISEYNGEILETNPHYFNTGFIERVQSNNNKISGVYISWKEKTQLQEQEELINGQLSCHGITFGFATDKKVAYADYAPANTSHNPYDHAHFGIDIKDELGSPIYAAADGEVLFFSPNGGGDDGIYVMLKHNDHVATTYCHMQSVSDLIANCREEGAQKIIKKGDIIGYMGSTGTDTVHLHIRLSVNEAGTDNPEDFSRINPNTYFPYTYETNPGATTFTGEL